MNHPRGRCHRWRYHGPNGEDEPEGSRGPYGIDATRQMQKKGYCVNRCERCGLERRYFDSKAVPWHLVDFGTIKLWTTYNPQCPGKR